MLINNEDAFTNIEIPKPRTLKKESTPIDKPELHNHLLTRLVLKSSGAYSFYNA